MYWSGRVKRSWVRAGFGLQIKACEFLTETERMASEDMVYTTQVIWPTFIVFLEHVIKQLVHSSKSLFLFSTEEKKKIAEGLNIN